MSQALPQRLTPSDPFTLGFERKFSQRFFPGEPRGLELLFASRGPRTRVIQYHQEIPLGTYDVSPFVIELDNLRAKTTDHHEVCVPTLLTSLAQSGSPRLFSRLDVPFRQAHLASTGSSQGQDAIAAHNDCTGGLIADRIIVSH